MSILANYVQTGDWKGEKHVPVIHTDGKFKAGEAKEVRLSIGDAVAHPNTFEHHISWFKLFFLAEGAKFPVELATFHFFSHGEGDLFTEPAACAKVKLPSSGKLIALSYCNIHGLWENSLDVTVE
ncbi:MAG: class II SORL domain-containing protein [Peptostreptococcaceae bacterium]|nr:class II SORL domain-containing protein [Peptostreptococcaceae bacterium]